MGFSIKKKLDEILAVVSATMSGDAVAANVLAGKTFYNTSSSTLVTGTMANRAGATAATSGSITSGTTLSVLPTVGYRDGVDDTVTIDLTTVDTDLVAANIKSGVTILGVLGTYTGA